MDFIGSNSISTIRMCDDGDAESIFKLINNMEAEYSNKSLATASWSLEQLEDDLCKGSAVWYVLEVEEEDEEDVVIAVARLSYHTSTDEFLSKSALIDSLFFAPGLYTESASVSIIKSFLTHLETTSFHMQAQGVEIEVEQTKLQLQDILHSYGYNEQSGYLIESSQCMVIRYMKALVPQSNRANILDVDKGAEERVVVEEEGGFEILSDDASFSIASIMPDLFSALHKEYGGNEGSK